MWARINALVRKEFFALFRDKKSRFSILAPPVIQLLIFGYAASFDLNHVPYMVYNEDTGYASRMLLARFEGSPTFSKQGTIQSDNEIAQVMNWCNR